MKGASNRGFASMDAQRQREIASKGGRAAHERHTAHEFSVDEARQAGHKGGLSVSRNKEHMSNIGRKGGVSVSRNRQHMSAIGRRGGVAVSRNRQHMSDIGREGGQSRSSPREDGMPAGPFAENENRNPLLTQPEDFQPPAAQHHP